MYKHFYYEGSNIFPGTHYLHCPLFFPLVIIQYFYSDYTIHVITILIVIERKYRLWYRHTGEPEIEDLSDGSSSMAMEDKIKTTTRDIGNS